MRYRVTVNYIFGEDPRRVSVETNATDEDEARYFAELIVKARFQIARFQIATEIATGSIEVVGPDGVPILFQLCNNEDAFEVS